MSQPSRKGKTTTEKKRKSRPKTRFDYIDRAIERKKKGVKAHPKYGTSKLEEKFAHEFLDKLGVEYIYQFEAKEIGRFFDFKIKGGPIIEVQGSYWHGDKRLYEEKDLNATQKRNRTVDKIKLEWALKNGINVVYVWEKDINENPSKVMRELKKALHLD